VIKSDVTFVAVVGAAHTLHCNGCTACCRWGAVVLQPNDRPEDYETAPLGDLTVLKQKEDGKTCWYLDEEKGCTIYDKRPTVCRAFDCRLYGLQVVGSKVNDRDHAVITAGMERLRLAADELGKTL
jgi:hypothetical protein